MSEKFDDYKIQEGCTVQPQTKEEWLTLLGMPLLLWGMMLI